MMDCAGKRFGIFPGTDLLPYMGYIGMHNPKGYVVFQPFCL